MARASVKGGDKSFEYEDCGEEDSKDARKEGDDGDADKNL